MVVLGHAIQYGNGASYLASEQHYDNPLFRFVYSFHMPLFMLISGYLLAFSLERRSSRQVFTSRLRRLGVPILTFALLIKGASVAAVAKGDTTFLQWAEGFLSFSVMNYHLWFLWSVLFNTFFVVVIRRLGDSPALYLLAWAGLLLMPEGTLHGVYSFMFPCFAAGYLAGKHRFAEQKRPEGRWLFALSLVLFAVGLSLYGKETYVYVSGQCVLRSEGARYFWLDMLRLVTGMAGSLCVLTALKWLYSRSKENPVTRSIIALGRDSMGIYLFQTLFFFLSGRLSLMPFTGHHAADVTLTFALCLAFSFACTRLARLNRLSNFFFLGGSK